MAAFFGGGGGVIQEGPGAPCYEILTWKQHWCDKDLKLEIVQDFVCVCESHCPEREMWMD